MKSKNQLRADAAHARKVTADRRKAQAASAEVRSAMVSTRQQLFVEEYVRTWNGTKSAIFAGYGSPAITACKMLKLAKIRAAVRERLQAAQLNTDKVLARLSEMANGNVADFVSPRGKLNHQEFKRRGYLVKKYRKPAKGGAEIEMYDAQAALVHVGKHLGMFKEQVEVAAPGGGPVQHEFTITLAEPDLDATAPKQRKEAA